MFERKPYLVWFSRLLKGYTVLCENGLSFITKSLTFMKRAVHVTFNPRTYTQYHTPTMVEGGGRNPSSEFLICCSISK